MKELATRFNLKSVILIRHRSKKYYTGCYNQDSRMKAEYAIDPAHNLNIYSVVHLGAFLVGHTFQTLHQKIIQSTVLLFLTNLFRVVRPPHTTLVILLRMRSDIILVFIIPLMGAAMEMEIMLMIPLPKLHLRLVVRWVETRVRVARKIPFTTSWITLLIAV